MIVTYNRCQPTLLLVSQRVILATNIIVLSSHIVLFISLFCCLLLVLAARPAGARHHCVLAAESKVFLLQQTPHPETLLFLARGMIIRNMTYHKRKSFSSSKVLNVVVALVILLSIVNLMHYSTELLTLDRGPTNSADILSSQHVLDRTLPKSLDVIMNHVNQVFMIMPPKAAGTTMNAFTRKCTGIEVPGINFMNTEKETTFINNYEEPSIISSHLFIAKCFIDIVMSAIRETLIIYIHREELPRIRSAIRHVLMSKVCVEHSIKGKGLKKKYHFDVEKKGNRCTIDEEHLIRIIKGKEDEIGFSTSTILTCKSFDVIAQNTPSNLVFVNYKQANKLQKILAKYHCPHLVKDLPFTENVAADKLIEPFIRLKTDSSREVTFEEWFDKKQNLILFALDLKQNIGCQSKIMDMEDHLFLCPDEAVIFFRGEFQCISLSE